MNVFLKFSKMIGQVYTAETFYIRNQKARSYNQDLITGYPETLRRFPQSLQLSAFQILTYSTFMRIFSPF